MTTVRFLHGINTRGAVDDTALDEHHSPLARRPLLVAVPRARRMRRAPSSAGIRRPIGVMTAGATPVASAKVMPGLEESGTVPRAVGGYRGARGVGSMERNLAPVRRPPGTRNGMFYGCRNCNASI
jgi:hypothetical protein